MPWLLLLRRRLVSSRLDQMNSVLYGTALKHTGRLQRFQRALARVVVNQRSRVPFSSNELLKQLHWLPLVAHTVQTRYLNCQGIAYWSPAISH